MLCVEPVTFIELSFLWKLCHSFQRAGSVFPMLSLGRVKVEWVQFLSWEVASRAFQKVVRSRKLLAGLYRSPRYRLSCCDEAGYMQIKNTRPPPSQRPWVCFDVCKAGRWGEWPALLSWLLQMAAVRLSRTKCDTESVGVSEDGCHKDGIPVLIEVFMVFVGTPWGGHLVSKNSDQGEASLRKCLSLHWQVL